MKYDDYEKPQSYHTFLPIEGIVAAQINRIMEYRSKKIIEHFEEAVDALIDLLPPDVEESILKYKKENNIYYDLSQQGKEKYVMLFRMIKKQLSDCNIVWRRGGFLVGHD